jgi:hypothetical protein
MEVPAATFKPVIEPELKALLPRQTPEEIDILEKSLRTEGLRDKLTVWKRGPDDFVLIDGMTRFEICERIGIPIDSSRYQIVELKDMNGAKKWMLRNQLGRRNLTDTQRAMIGARLADLEKGANQHGTRDSTSQAKAAEVVGVSRKSITRAKKVLKKGAPELIDAVDSGKVDVKSAAKVADLPKEEQAAVVAKGPKAVRRRALEGVEVEEKITESGIPYRSVTSLGEATKKKPGKWRANTKARLAEGMGKEKKASTPPARIRDILAECVQSMQYVAEHADWLLEKKHEEIRSEWFTDLKFDKGASFRGAASNLLLALERLSRKGMLDVGAAQTTKKGK